MKKKFVIIGSHSFAGGHVVHHALAQGFHVLGLNQSAKKSNPFNPYDWKTGNKHNLTLKQLDATDHPNKTINIINDYQPHCIICCTDEGHIEIYDQLRNHPSIVVTPAAHIYGPGQEVHELIPKIILSLLLGKNISLHKEDHIMRPLLHINDLTAGIFKASCAGVPGKIYTLTTNRFISKHELVTLICKRMNIRLENIMTIPDDSSDKKKDELLETVTVHHELNWQPTIELEEGIDSVIAWVQEWLPALKNYSMVLEK